MIKLLSVAIVAGLFLESNQQDLALVENYQYPELPCFYPTNTRCWTDWFDRDNPTGTGDWETISNLRDDNPGKICSDPLGIEARTLSGLSVGSAGDVIYRNDITYGFVCKNSDQTSKRLCNDYRVRFSCYPPFCGQGVCWTQWYDRDNPGGSGDWELLRDLRSEFPGEICDHPVYIEAVTADTMKPAIKTGEVFEIFNPSQGFVCRNTDQESGTCSDYKVRFGCVCDKEEDAL